MSVLLFGRLQNLNLVKFHNLWISHHPHFIIFVIFRTFPFLTAIKCRHDKSWNPSTDRFLGVCNFLKMEWFATWYFPQKHIICENFHNIAFVDISLDDNSQKPSEITSANNSRMGKNTVILTKQFLNIKNFHRQPLYVYIFSHV